MSRLLCTAIAVPPPLGQRIDRARALLRPGKRHMAAHITVVPPTRIQDEDLDAVVQQVLAACAGLPAFDVALDGVGSFRPRTPAVFLRVTAGASEAEAVHRALATGLLATDERRYRAHVTIANRCPAPLLDAAEEAFAGFRAGFRAADVTVFEHGLQGWTPLAVAPLGR